MKLSQEEIEKKIKDSYEVPNSVISSIPDPIVTVRTSTYQHADYIKDCIEGVLMQKITFPIEFIIGEDFSTDGTRELVFEYARNYPNLIRVITADYNVGSRANGRRCIRAARGKYMALCEGDDYWTDPYKLQKQVDFLEENPDYSICFHAAKHIFENDPEKNFINRPKPIPEDYTFSLEDVISRKGSFVPTNSIVFRSKYIGIRPEWMDKASVGDVPLLLLLGTKGKIGYIDELMGVYRAYALGSWSEIKKSDRRKRENHYKSLIKMWKSFDEWTEYKYNSLIKRKIKIIKYKIYLNKIKNYINVI